MAASVPDASLWAPLLQFLEPQKLFLVTAHPFFFLCRYLENHLANLFAGAWEPQPKGPLPLDIPMASLQQVDPLSSSARTPTWQDSPSLSRYWGLDLGG